MKKLSIQSGNFDSVVVSTYYAPEDLRILENPIGFYARADISKDENFCSFSQYVNNACAAFGKIPTCEPHCTLAYSVGSLPTNLPLIFEVSEPIKVTAIEYWEGHDHKGYLVAVLHSRSLERIHKVLEQAGCAHSFSDYTPHITLRNDVGLFDPNTVLNIFNKSSIDNVLDSLNRNLPRFKKPLSVRALVFEDLKDEDNDDAKKNKKS